MPLKLETSGVSFEVGKAVDSKSDRDTGHQRVEKIGRPPGAGPADRPRRADQVGDYHRHGGWRAAQGHGETTPLSSLLCRAGRLLRIDDRSPRGPSRTSDQACADSSNPAAPSVEEDADADR